MEVVTIWAGNQHGFKEVQMSIKMEPKLRDHHGSVAAGHRRPAAQIIRDLMRFYIAGNKTPNALTAETFSKSGRGEGVFSATSAGDPFNLGYLMQRLLLPQGCLHGCR